MKTTMKRIARTAEEFKKATGGNTEKLSLKVAEMLGISNESASEAVDRLLFGIICLEEATDFGTLDFDDEAGELCWTAFAEKLLEGMTDADACRHCISLVGTVAAYGSVSEEMKNRFGELAGELASVEEQASDEEYARLREELVPITAGVLEGIAPIVAKNSLPEGRFENDRCDAYDFSYSVDNTYRALYTREHALYLAAAAYTLHEKGEIDFALGDTVSDRACAVGAGAAAALKMGEVRAKWSVGAIAEKHALNIIQYIAAAGAFVGLVGALTVPLGIIMGDTGLAVIGIVSALAGGAVAFVGDKFFSDKEAVHANCVRVIEKTRELCGKLKAKAEEKLPMLTYNLELFFNAVGGFIKRVAEAARAVLSATGRAIKNTGVAITEKTAELAGRATEGIRRKAESARFDVDAGASV